MTFRELVSRISRNTVTGSWSESRAWLQTRPAKASPTARHATTAARRHATTPTEECLSWMSYSSPNMPAVMVPAAMAAVTLLESPANSSATAKIVELAGPRMGESVAAAAARSSMTMPCEKNVVAARITIAEFIAQPTPIEKSVSNSS